MKSIRVLGVVSIVLAAFTGCYGARSDGDDDSGFVAEDDFIDGFPEQLCNQLAGCCGTIGFDIDAVSCTSELRLNLADLGGPNASFDGNAAAACQSNYYDALAHCNLPSDEQVEPCLDIYHGSVPIGGSCEDDAECIDGAYCYYDAASFVGSCQSYQAQPGAARGAPGEACSGSCYQYGTEELCDASGGFAGASCYSSDNLYCDYLTNTCTQLPGQGESCSNSYFCQNGLHCDQSLICSPPLADGSPCYEDAECAHVCGNEGLCVSAEPVGADICGEFAP